MNHATGKFITTIIAVVFSTGLASNQVRAATGDEPAAVVKTFNSAISARDQNTAIAQLATGGVQLTLRSLHEGVNPDKMVAPITEHWNAIAPVIFGSTESYLRQVEILSTELHGDIATVWAQTSTVSVRKNQAKESTNTFTEIYLLVNTPNGWKIATLADNRQATKLSTGNK